MQQLNATQIKKSFINTSRREAEKITPPADLAEIEWAKLEYFGWADTKIPQRAYIIVPVGDVPRGLMLRVVPIAKSQAMCSWCEDLHQSPVRVGCEAYSRCRRSSSSPSMTNSLLGIQPGASKRSLRSGTGRTCTSPTNRVSKLRPLQTVIT